MPYQSLGSLRQDLEVIPGGAAHHVEDFQDELHGTGAQQRSAARGKRRHRTQRSLFSALPAVQAATLRGDDFQAWESLKVRAIERADSVHTVCRQGGDKLQIEDGSAAHGVAAQHLQPA